MTAIEQLGGGAAGERGGDFGFGKNRNRPTVKFFKFEKREAHLYELGRICANNWF